MATPTPADGIPGDPSLRRGTRAQVLILALFAALVTSLLSGMNGIVQMADRLTDDTRFVAVADGLRAFDEALRRDGITAPHDRLHAGLKALEQARFAPEEQ